jgi:diguanylate cyclase (GGDEF)-like protein
VNPVEAALALQRWSVVTQFGVVTLVASFFLILARSVRLVEVRLWAWAWSANAVALAAVFLTAFTKAPWPAARAALAAYAAGKTAFAVMLVGGARSHVRRGVELPFPRGRVAALVGMWSAALAALAPSLQAVQVGQALMTGAVLTTGSLWVLRNPRDAESAWLGWPMLFEGLLFLHYVPLLLPALAGGRPLVGYVAYSSYLDTAAELLVALGTLVSLQTFAIEHLRHLNEELVASQAQLRSLADLDPLTGLANRRALREMMTRARNAGGVVAFLDIRGFKRINEGHGHIVGDACLRRVASALKEVFRTGDGLFRWGGDEFLVVAPGLDSAGAAERLEHVRRLVAQAGADGPPLGLSVGVAYLPRDGEPDSALREADRAMVADKARGRA